MVDDHGENLQISPKQLLRKLLREYNNLKGSFNDPLDEEEILAISELTTCTLCGATCRKTIDGVYQIINDATLLRFFYIYPQMVCQEHFEIEYALANKCMVCENIALRKANLKLKALFLDYIKEKESCEK